MFTIVWNPGGFHFVAIEEARDIFAQFVPDITKHTALTLARAFDKNDGTFDYKLLLQYMRV
jgi:hypothetical protein